MLVKKLSWRFQLAAEPPGLLIIPFERALGYAGEAIAAKLTMHGVLSWCVHYLLMIRPLSASLRLSLSKSLCRVDQLLSYVHRL